MIYGVRPSWKTMAGTVVVAVGLGTVIFPGMGHAETCTLSPIHRDVWFSVEKAGNHWTCRLQEIIDTSIVSNRVGPIPVALSVSLYQYLLDRPPLAAGLIKQLDLGVYQSETRGPDLFWGDDGEGTRGLVQLVYKDATFRMYYLEGSHDSRFLPPLKGKAVVLLSMHMVQDSVGTESMESTLVSYTKLDNRFFSGVASLLRPWVEGIVTRKLTKAVETVDRLGLVMRQHPERVLSEAIASPAFADADVAFLRKAFAEQQNVDPTGNNHYLLP